jgi:hypothetical protein
MSERGDGAPIRKVCQRAKKLAGVAKSSASITCGPLKRVRLRQCLARTLFTNAKFFGAPRRKQPCYPLRPATQNLHAAHLSRVLAAHQKEDTTNEAHAAVPPVFTSPHVWALAGRGTRRSDRTCTTSGYSRRTFSVPALVDISPALLAAFLTERTLRGIWCLDFGIAPPRKASG